MHDAIEKELNLNYTASFANSGSDNPLRASGFRYPF